MSAHWACAGHCNLTVFFLRVTGGNHGRDPHTRNHHWHRWTLLHRQALPRHSHRHARRCRHPSSAWRRRSNTSISNLHATLTRGPCFETALHATWVSAVTGAAWRPFESTSDCYCDTTLATLGQTKAPVLALRIQSALRAGLSRREIVDVVGQMALGTRLPVAQAATKVAADVFSRTSD
jgi:hypothetical protein